MNKARPVTSDLLLSQQPPKSSSDFPCVLSNGHIYSKLCWKYALVMSCRHNLIHLYSEIFKMAALATDRAFLYFHTKKVFDIKGILRVQWIIYSTLRSNQSLRFVVSTTNPTDDDCSTCRKSPVTVWTVKLGREEKKIWEFTWVYYPPLCLSWIFNQRRNHCGAMPYKIFRD